MERVYQHHETTSVPLVNRGIRGKTAYLQVGFRDGYLNNPETKLKLRARSGQGARRAGWMVAVVTKAERSDPISTGPT